MKIVFLGTPEYVLPVIELLHKTFSKKGISPIVGVVTQSPRPAGRKQFMTYSAVDSWAHKKSVPVYYSALEFLKDATQADIGILAAYGEIVPGSVIKSFPYGILNIHPSLLPKYRGASPVQAAIASGESETGATIIKIDEKMDHGPIVSQFKEEVGTNETLETLRSRLFARAADVLAALIEPYIQGKIKLREQNHEEATSTSLIKKEHGFIPAKYVKAAMEGKTLKGKWEIDFIKDFSLPPSPEVLERFIRALSPWPGAWTFLKLGSGWNFSEKRLKILEAHLEEKTLVLDQVQLEGKNPVSWKEFSLGYPKMAFGND